MPLAAARGPVAAPRFPPRALLRPLPFLLLFPLVAPSLLLRLRRLLLRLVVPWTRAGGGGRPAAALRLERALSERRRRVYCAIPITCQEKEGFVPP